MITINIDLGSAQAVDTLIIFDHNLSATATITLVGVEPTIFSEAVTRTADKILHYLSVSTTKRYWQLQITDAANTDGYIEIGEIFLGTYLELTHNYAEGFTRNINFLMDTNQTAHGIQRDGFYNKQNEFQFDFNGMLAADVTSIEALLEAICLRGTRQFQAFWFNSDSAVFGNTWLVKVISPLPIKHRSLGYYDLPLQLKEVLTSV